MGCSGSAEQGPGHTGVHTGQRQECAQHSSALLFSLHPGTGTVLTHRPGVTETSVGPGASSVFDISGLIPNTSLALVDGVLHLTHCREAEDSRWGGPGRCHSTQITSHLPGHKSQQCPPPLQSQPARGLLVSRFIVVPKADAGTLSGYW